MGTLDYGQKHLAACVCDALGAGDVPLRTDGALASGVRGQVDALLSQFLCHKSNVFNFSSLPAMPAKPTAKSSNGKGQKGKRPRTLPCEALERDANKPDQWAYETGMFRVYLSYARQSAHAPLADRGARTGSEVNSFLADRTLR